MLNSDHTPRGLIVNDNRSWRPIYQAMCPEPGPRDLFLVILINGARAGVHPIDERERWKYAAERLANEKECQVKVLPTTGAELMGFLRIEPRSGPLRPLEELDPEFRKQALRNCEDVLCQSAEPRERAEALDLLRALGVLQ